MMGWSKRVSAVCVSPDCFVAIIGAELQFDIPELHVSYRGEDKLGLLELGSPFVASKGPVNIRVFTGWYAAQTPSLHG